MDIKWSNDKKIDLKIGAWLRKKRGDLGLTQNDVSKQSGLTIQQIGKYEKGLNRVPTSFLLHFCKKNKIDPKEINQVIRMG